MFTLNPPKTKTLCIYGVARPLYCFGRLFGFFPFSLKTETNGECIIRFTVMDLVIFVVQVAIYSCFTYVNIFFDLIGNSAMSAILALGTRVGLIFGLMNSVAFLFADLFNRNRIFDIFKSFENFDLQMKLLGSSLNNNRIKRYVYVYLGAWTGISLLYSSISYWIFRDLYQLHIFVVSFTSFYLATTVFGIALSIYSFFIFNVRARYFLLNYNLSKLPIYATERSNVRHLIENVMKLGELHDKVTNILDRVNKCYSIQAMLALAVSFTFVVFSLFSVYRGWIMSTVSKQQLYLSLVLSIWATFYIFFVLTVLWAGHSSKNEGKFTGVLVHRAINKCHNSEIVERLMAFSSQINNRIPDANCNLFSFDWTLLFSVMDDIVAATTTYLIILIQFDASGYNPVSFGSKNFSFNN